MRVLVLVGMEMQSFGNHKQVTLEKCLFQPCQIFALHFPRGETMILKRSLAHEKCEAQSDVPYQIDAGNPELLAYFAFKCHYLKTICF